MERARAQTYRERGLAVLAVSVDREGASVVAAVREAPRAELPHRPRPQQTVARLYRDLGPPFDHRPEPEWHPALLGPGCARVGQPRPATRFSTSLLKQGS